MPLLNITNMKTFEINNWKKYIVNKYKKVYKLLIEGDFDSVDKIEMALKQYIIDESTKIENSKIVENVLLGMAMFEREKTYILASQAKNKMIA
jgi:hypothetical protein